ncbi:MAG TPA: pentapeptide repeat-containing protein [Mycobacteriales bacterium]|nr:pentapeptide repeat-containing protein [Mycobacteriales bacterium]
MPVCRKPHGATPPNLSTEAPSTDGLVLDDGDASSQWLSGVRVLELDLDRPQLVDLRLDECDLSAITANGFGMRRVAMRGTRLRGVALSKGQYDDGLLEDCTTDEFSMRFSGLRNVVFRNCDLTGADFYQAGFDHVTFEGCRLRTARFHAVSIKCLRISNCDLSGVVGALDLKGAVVDIADLPSLAPSLAGEVGIELTD